MVPAPRRALQGAKLEVRALEMLVPQEGTESVPQHFSEANWRKGKGEESFPLT